jgi:hypothetical protein
VNDSSGRRVCIWYAGVECLSPGDPDLIAAAPRMLELLKSMPGFHSTRSDEIPALSEWFAKVNSLLAEIDDATAPGT